MIRRSFAASEVRDAANARLMSDDRMKNMKMPFDGSRMILGGFSTLLDD